MGSPGTFRGRPEANLGEIMGVARVARIGSDRVGRRFPPVAPFVGWNGWKAKFGRNYAAWAQLGSFSTVSIRICRFLSIQGSYCVKLRLISLVEAEFSRLWFARQFCGMCNVWQVAGACTV